MLHIVQFIKSHNYYCDTLHMMIFNGVISYSSKYIKLINLSINSFAVTLSSTSCFTYNVIITCTNFNTKIS